LGCGRRAAGSFAPAREHLAVGDTTPDSGGRNATFEVAMLQAPAILVDQSARGPANLTWPVTLTPVTKTRLDHPDSRTRIHLRLRPIRPKRLAAAGKVTDILTIAGMAAELRE
jgi:hypothetical protein